MKKFLLLGALAAGLSSCTIDVRHNVGLSGSSANLISEFYPTRGEASTYRVGEAVSFRVSTRADGYLTLLALQDGQMLVVLQNVFIKSGTYVFPRAEDNRVLNVALPEGTQRVRAIFTKVRPTTDLVLRGVYDGNAWHTVTEDYLKPYAPEERDVQETFFYIRQN